MSNIDFSAINIPSLHGSAQSSANCLFDM